VVPAQVTAEADHLLRTRFGSRPARALLEDLSTERFRAFCLDATDYRLAAEYDRQYADFDVGLSDLAIVVAAHRISTNRLMTFDERHFRALRPLDGGSFVLLPADEAASG